MVIFIYIQEKGVRTVVCHKHGDSKIGVSYITISVTSKLDVQETLPTSTYGKVYK